MQKILQFIFFFGNPEGYTLKSETVRAQLDDMREESRKKNCPLNEDGSYPPGLRYRPCYTEDKGFNCRTTLDFSHLPIIFTNMIMQDYEAFIIRKNFYKSDTIFIMDMQVNEEQFEMFQMTRHEIFEELFGEYEWTEYNIKSVEITHQKELERFISKQTGAVL